jgi:hypothetical protein
LKSNHKVLNKGIVLSSCCKRERFFLFPQNQLDRRKNIIFKFLFFFQTLLIFFFLVVPGRAIASQASSINWHRVAQIKPDLKVLVQVKADHLISLDDLAFLADIGMIPADRDPGLVLGVRQAIFSVKLKSWMTKTMPDHLHAKLLDRFTMNGIYRVSFRVEKEGYQGPLSFEITTPRDGFGQQLISSEGLVRPQGPNWWHIDNIGNRWFYVDYSQMNYGETIRFHFAFKYLVDMAMLLSHDLMLLEQSGDGSVPEEVQPFLTSGYKINSSLPQAVKWAREGVPGPPYNVRSEYQRLTRFIKNTIIYNQQKRDQYFGGRTVYSDMDHMYQDITTTLTLGLGACPDTSLLECAFLRARGIPCRIGGRFGHFFTHVYVPGKGWMSTSVNPTGIPLIIAPGPDHIPYQRWRPDIPLRTTLLETKVRIEPEED